MTRSDSPLIATAIHNGHDLRPEVAASTALSDGDRRREEDPLTYALTAVAPTRITVNRSRFEVDLNRPRNRAVYRTPEDAWGLDLWKSPLSDEMVAASLQLYDRFYEELAGILDAAVAAHGTFVLLDFHSYNHRRGGPAAPPDPPELNPDINIGTGSLHDERWRPLIDRFMTDLSRPDEIGSLPDVRENVRFRGGHLSHWVHERYAESGCALAIELKKTFMDEWTGVASGTEVQSLVDRFSGAVPALLDGLSAL